MFAVMVLSTSCENPIQSYLNTQTALMETATATLWTPTSTNTLTNSPTPTRTITPTKTITPTQTPTSTRDPNLFTETKATKMFSYIPPKGWQSYIYIDTNFTFWNGPGGCKLAFYQQKTNVSPRMYATIEMEDLMNELNYFKYIASGPYYPASGLEAYSFSFIMGGNKYVAIYIFSDGVWLLEAQFIRPPSCPDTQDALIATTMRSMQYE